MLIHKTVWMAALVLTASVAQAQSAAETKKSRQPATPREQLKSEAKGLALGSEVAEAISENQLAIASRVLTGRASCEFDQHVSVEPVSGQPGRFQVGFKNATYVMSPEETSSGAVRLQDRKAGVVWLQIPSKSMLMNSKLGQRLVDNCMQTEQRVAVDAAKAAGK
jgi:hypothetical protein